MDESFGSGFVLDNPHTRPEVGIDPIRNMFEDHKLEAVGVQPMSILDCNKKQLNRHPQPRVQGRKMRFFFRR